MNKISEADFEILSNINTRPGPNAGRSIDPTKPGPDAQPDDTQVICPNCAHQFRAISVADQARLRQSDCPTEGVAARQGNGA